VRLDPLAGELELELQRCLKRGVLTDPMVRDLELLDLCRVMARRLLELERRLAELERAGRPRPNLFA